MVKILVQILLCGLFGAFFLTWAIGAIGLWDSPVLELNFDAYGLWGFCLGILFGIWEIYRARTATQPNPSVSSTSPRD